MGKLQWYYNRLRAMSLREVMWRISQKRIQKQEKAHFGRQRINIGGEIWNPLLRKLSFSPDALGINFKNKVHSVNTKIHLLAGPDYDCWPDTFSYELDYKQRDDWGDARTNWEKNRHFQWVLLAKAYYISHDHDSLLRLEEEVCAWTARNPFLHGISWTSAMELAIRSINWMYALAFLQKVGIDNNITNLLSRGVINMTEYLTLHYSRFSSANNHLLVEAAAIGIAGYAFEYKPWKELALRILTEELYRQNYKDGVNRELSLHYQTFGMEAYFLLSHVSGEKSWLDLLRKEAEFVAHSCWREKAVVEFGDDDEGKILDLQGGEWHHWEYILQFASLMTGVRFSTFDCICENIHWLFTEEDIERIKQLPLYDHSSGRTFETGGITFFRDKEDRILIGIDHAALGFGSIAAHGHADALSFQLLIDGVSVFADPGTYIYHCWLPERDKFRKTVNHNTLCIINEDGTTKDQSHMLGAFMWGSRAECQLLSFTHDSIVAEHDGYRPNLHRRAFYWDWDDCFLTIEDTLKKECAFVLTFLIGEKCDAKEIRFQDRTKGIRIKAPSAEVEMNFQYHDGITLEDAEISPAYGRKVQTKAIRVYGHETKVMTTIKIKKWTEKY